MLPYVMPMGEDSRQQNQQMTIGRTSKQAKNNHSDNHWETIGILKTS